MNPPMMVWNAGLNSLKISLLSTSFDHNPKRNAPTIANTDRHRVALTIRVTANVNRALMLSFICFPSLMLVRTRGLLLRVAKRCRMRPPIPISCSKYLRSFGYCIHFYPTIATWLYAVPSDHVLSRLLHTSPVLNNLAIILSLVFPVFLAQTIT